MSGKQYQRFTATETTGEQGNYFNSYNTNGKFWVRSEKRGEFVAVIVEGCLAWNAFCIINATLHKIVRESKSETIIVDLTRVSKAYTEGVIPLIALLRRHRKDGVSFRVNLPRDHSLRATFNNHNWSHFLDDRFGKSKRTLNRTTGLIEFDSIETLNNLMRQAMNMIIRAVNFKSGSRESLEWSLFEITDNVVRHSGEDGGWFEVTWSTNGIISFTVCDCGVGIPRPMRQAFPEIRSDESALAKAVEEGVTSSNDGQGNGLAGTLAIVEAAQGHLVINSLRGHLRYDHHGLRFQPVNIPYPGTYVSFSIRDSQEIDLKTLTWGIESFTYAKYDFNPDDKENYTIPLLKEAESFGNRATGLKVRILIENVIIDSKGKKVIVDFDGVTIISSSFADEVFGKFALSHGVLAFGRLIGVVNASRFIESLIDKVVMQRVAQGFGEGALRPTPLTDEP